MCNSFDCLRVSRFKTERHRAAAFFCWSRRAGRCNGFLFATTPCGHILHMKPYVGAESLSQRFFFLGELVEAVGEINVLIHDDSCHLRRFSERNGDRTELTNRLRHPRIRYILDRMHATGHSDPWCIRECHPDAPQNAQLVQDLNTSAAEVLNSLMSRHRHAVRCIRSRYVRDFFLQEVADSRNTVAGPEPAGRARVGERPAEAAPLTPPGRARRRRRAFGPAGHIEHTRTHAHTHRL